MTEQLFSFKEKQQDFILFPRQRIPTSDFLLSRNLFAHPRWEERGGGLFWDEAFLSRLPRRRESATGGGGGQSRSLILKLSSRFSQDCCFPNTLYFLFFLLCEFLSTHFAPPTSELSPPKGEIAASTIRDESCWSAGLLLQLSRCSGCRSKVRKTHTHTEGGWGGGGRAELCAHRGPNSPFDI